MDEIIKATDGKEYLVTSKEYELSMTMAEMLRDYVDGVQENALRLAQYRDHIRPEARAEALKEAASILQARKDRADETDEWWEGYIDGVDDSIRDIQSRAILADEPKEERGAEGPCCKCVEEKGAPPCEFCGPPAWEAFKEREAEVDDIVTWTNSHGARMIGIFGREITQGDAIILMRRAEVEAIISRGGI